VGRDPLLNLLPIHCGKLEGNSGDPGQYQPDNSV
jgi:hypothetical protein